MSIKILVVTDSATDLSIIKNALSEYRIVYACNSSEALQKIDTNSDIGLVLIDLALSNMEGLHLLSTLRFDNQYKDLSTIILTDYYEVDKEIEGLKLGAIDYIRKPFHIDSLVIKIEMYIEMLRMQQLIANQLDEHHLMFDIIFQQAPIGIAIAYNRELSPSRFCGQ